MGVLPITLMWQVGACDPCSAYQGPLSPHVYRLCSPFSYLVEVLFFFLNFLISPRAQNTRLHHHSALLLASGQGRKQLLLSALTMYSHSGPCHTSSWEAPQLCEGSDTWGLGTQAVGGSAPLKLYLLLGTVWAT